MKLRTKTLKKMMALLLIAIIVHSIGYFCCKFVTRETMENKAGEEDEEGNSNGVTMEDKEMDEIIQSVRAKLSEMGSDLDKLSKENVELSEKM